MASRKRIDIGPTVVKTRGDRPTILGGSKGAMGLRYLQPRVRGANGHPIHSPVYVWACRTPVGWHGWLEEVRNANRKTGVITPPVDGWSHDMWEETIDPAGRALAPGKELRPTETPRRKVGRR